MSVPLPTTQVIHLLQKKRVTKDNRGEPAGDWPPMTIVTPNSMAVPRALAHAYHNNRLADTFRVTLEDEAEFSYQTTEFEHRLQKFIGEASRPGMTIPKFLEIFTQPVDTTKQ